MDRSFLSQPEVIAASRQFVCVRLATYEDQGEGAFLKSLSAGRSGELENTVFCILAANGKDQLIRPARGPERSFADAQAMAAGMNRIAKTLTTRVAPAALPLVADVRLAVDVAASDNQPLVIVVARDAAARSRLEQRVAALAWDAEFIGRFVYASTAGGQELASVDGVGPDAGLLVVEADQYGLKGKVLKQCAGEPSRERLAETLRAGANAFEGTAKSFRTHVRQGQLEGIFWETRIPVTDPMEQRARERGRRQTKE